MLRTISVEVVAPHDHRIIIAATSLSSAERLPMNHYLASMHQSYPAFSYWVGGEQQPKRWRIGTMLIPSATLNAW